MFKFDVKVFIDLVFGHPLMALNHKCYDDRCWYEILFSISFTPGHDLYVEVTDLDILFRSLRYSWQSF